MAKFGIVILFAILVTLCEFILTTTATPSGKFFHISDIHLDLLFDNSANAKKSCKKVSNSKWPMGTYGCDSPAQLVGSALGKMASVDPNPDFILFTGDSLAHQIPVNIMNNTFSTVIQTFQLYFPNTPVIPVVGNHDINENYIISENDPDFATLYSFWGYSLSVWATGNPNLESTYMKGGYYYVALPNNLYVISLNTVYYVPKTTGYDQTITDPAGQFQFLRDTLSMISQQGGKAIIAQHVPQGANRAGNQLFETTFETTMTSIIQQYSETILVIYGGHMHRDYFRLYYQADGTTPAASMLLNGAITPQDGSNPSFTYFSYNDTNILDYDKYYLDISNPSGSWLLEYTFSTTYPESAGAITPHSLDLIISQFATSPTSLDQYILHSTSEYVSPNSSSTAGETCYDVCMATKVHYTDFVACAKANNCHITPSTSPASVPYPSLLFAVFIILVFLKCL